VALLELEANEQPHRGKWNVRTAQSFRYHKVLWLNGAKPHANTREQTNPIYADQMREYWWNTAGRWDFQAALLRNWQAMCVAGVLHVTSSERPARRPPDRGAGSRRRPSRLVAVNRTKYTPL